MARSTPRRMFARVRRRSAAAFARAARALSGRDASSAGGGWTLDRFADRETRWRRGDETVGCTAFRHGFVVTATTAAGRTWQLTPGPVELGTALATATLFLEHDLSPQTDRDGRLFVGVDRRTPCQVFTEEVPDSVRFVFLDGIRSLDEFPQFLPLRTDVQRAFRRMDRSRVSAPRRE